MLTITETSSVPPELWAQDSPKPFTQTAVTTIHLQYRSLRLGDKIDANDELLHDDCIAWQRVGAWCAGLPYQPNLYRPMRRGIGARMTVHR